ncbi:MAG: homoserine kinase [Actinobacteria bacterium]|nr:homoserine kinase [Actinomycetota bacterium]
MVEVNVPATTANLGPGFDVLGLALGLHNTIRMEEWGSGLSIRIYGEGSLDLPTDEENAVSKAAMRLFEEVDYRPHGLYIETVNKIPLGRGLGSSASAIVGGLVAANELAGAPLSHQEIFKMATQIEGHPDNVAAALFGGLTICYQTEDGWRSLPLRPADSIKAIVLIPDEQLPTSESRAVLPIEVTHADAVFNISRAALLVGAVLNGRSDMLPEATRDRLHQPYREPLIPGLDHFTANVREMLEIGVALSGAGPSIICLISASQEKEACRKLKGFIDERQLNYRIQPMEIDQCGVRVIRS